MEVTVLILAFIISFVTMFVGAIAGGVGLVLRPLLIFLGFPVLSVISSVRMADLFGQIPGIFLLNKNKRIDWKIIRPSALPIFFGSLIAALFVLSVPKAFLDQLIGIMLFLVGLLLLSRKREKNSAKIQSSSKMRNLLSISAAAILSFFNTIVGGMLPMFSSLYILHHKKSYIDASASARVASYLGSITASVVFVFANTIDWQLSLALAAGFALGSFLGVHYGLKKGEGWVRNLVLIVVFASAIKFIFFP